METTTRYEDLQDRSDLNMSYNNSLRRMVEYGIVPESISTYFTERFVQYHNTNPADLRIPDKLDDSILQTFCTRSLSIVMETKNVVLLEALVEFCKFVLPDEIASIQDSALDMDKILLSIKTAAEVRLSRFTIKQDEI